MRWLDKVAAWLVVLIGVVHVAVGYSVFIDPTERRVWFASAGFLLIITGLANLAAQAHPSRISNLTGAFGGGCILVLGILLVSANANILAHPQTFVLLALGLVLTVRRLMVFRVSTRQSSRNF